MFYKYETHAHTAEVSRCASISAVDLVRFYKKRGYSGICITDHFFNGNTHVPKDLPWEDRVDYLCSGYNIARREGQRIGLDVFFGWEWSFFGTDILTYGLSKDWLLENPDILDLSLNDYCDYARECGAFLAHAHPFREARFIEMIRLFPRKIDAVEVLNAERTDFVNDRANEYAENYDLLKIAGTDNHVGRLPRYCGIKSKQRFMDLEEMIAAVKNQEIELFTDIQA